MYSIYAGYVAWATIDLLRDLTSVRKVNIKKEYSLMNSIVKDIKMTKRARIKISIAFDKAIKSALDNHLKQWSLKTLDFMHADNRRADLQIAVES